MRQFRRVFIVLFPFFLASLVTRGSAYSNEKCQVDEKFNLALEGVQAPSTVLAEYSDVTTSTDCFVRCCEKVAEGCNAASFLKYNGVTVCMNVKCVPFEQCVWGPYPSARAGRVVVIGGNGTTAASGVTPIGGNSTTTPSSYNISSEDATASPSNTTLTNHNGTAMNTTDNNATSSLQNTKSAAPFNGNTQTTEQNRVDTSSEGYSTSSGNYDGTTVEVFWNVRTTESTSVSTSSDRFTETPKSWREKFTTDYMNSVSKSKINEYTTEPGYATSPSPSASASTSSSFPLQTPPSSIEHVKPTGSVDDAGDQSLHANTSKGTFDMSMGPYLVVGVCVCVAVLILFSILLAKRCSHAKERARYRPLKSDTEAAPYYDETNAK